VLTIRRCFIGAALAATVITTSFASAQAAPPQLMQDHASWTSSGAPLSWAKDDITLAISWDIFAGYSRGTRSADLRPLGGTGLVELPLAPEFAPQRSITRAEFAAILARVAGSDQEFRPGSRAPFRDTPVGAWYQPYITPLYERQIIRLTDYYLDQLGPDQPITRVEIAAWTARTFTQFVGAVPGAPLTFSDIPERFQYETELKQAVQLGIIRGYSDGTFRPENTANRAEAAVMITRLVRRMDRRLPSLQDLQAALQESLDAYDLYAKANQGQFPDIGKFKVALSPFYTASALEWYVTSDCVLCQNVGGRGYGGRETNRTYLSLAAQYVADRQTPSFRHLVHTVVEIEPLTLTDRFSVIKALVVRSTVTPQGASETRRFWDTFFIRREGGRWKVSSALPWQTAPTEPGDEGLSTRLDNR